MSSPKDFLKDLPDSATCLKALELYYWGAGTGNIKPRCPQCGETFPAQLPSKKSKLKWFHCTKRGCRTQFSLFTGTPFFRSRPKHLREWFEAYWFIQRGIKPSEFYLKIGLSHRETTRIAKKIKELERSEKGFLWKVRLRYLTHLKGRGGMTTSRDPLIDRSEYPEPTHLVRKKSKRKKRKERAEEHFQTSDEPVDDDEEENPLNRLPKSWEGPS
jgi:hypothetical protein